MNFVVHFWDDEEGWTAFKAYRTERAAQVFVSSKIGPVYGYFKVGESYGRPVLEVKTPRGRAKIVPELYPLTKPKA